MSLSLDDFIAEMHVNLDAFAADYRRHAAANPEHFPLVMESGQEGLWFEFFMEFSPNEEQEGLAEPSLPTKDSL